MLKILASFLGSVAASLAVLSLASVASAAEPQTKPGRDKLMLNQALDDSFQERQGVEAEYKTDRILKAETDRSKESHSIPVVLGDELGPVHSGHDQLKVHKSNSYHEKAVAAKLDKEWKEVNRSVKQSSYELKDPAQVPARKNVHTQNVPVEDDEF